MNSYEQRKQQLSEYLTEVKGASFCCYFFVVYSIAKIFDILIARFQFFHWTDNKQQAGNLIA